MGSGINDLGLKLGRQTSDAGLDPIPRSLGRNELDSQPDFFGFDLWNAWEVSFLLASGKPLVLHMQVTYGSDSPYMVESKSFKLFLNSFNNQEFKDVNAFALVVRNALSQCVGTGVGLTFYAPDQSPARVGLPGLLLDDLAYRPVACEQRGDKIRVSGQKGDFAFYSHLLRSNCPVTNQPDWGSVLIQGTGNFPEAESLLDYVISYRNHQGFHESCCEMIFADLSARLKPELLTVSCFYTRRGGLDINPCRSSQPIKRIQTEPVWRQ